VRGVSWRPPAPSAWWRAAHSCPGLPRRGPDPPPSELIDPWTEKVVTLGSLVVHRRHQFLQTFYEYLTAAYEKVDAVRYS